MENLIIISPYPPQHTTYENKYSALASFCKNTVQALKKINSSLNILVIADLIPQSNSWKENNLEIRRVWQRNTFKVYFPFLKHILKEKKTKKILIELEWALFGKNPLILGFMPFFIALLRLLGKQVYIIPHGVSLDFLSLAPSLGIKKKNIKALVYNLAFKLYYLGLVISASKIIVLEQFFANMINKKFHTSKAVFIPHGVDVQVKKQDNTNAKNQLKIGKDCLVFLNFGFLSWYKGSDILAHLFKNYISKYPDKNIKLIFAGGKSFIHKKDKVYKQFIEKIEKIVRDEDKIKITGFLPEDKLSLYFSAADVFVFPYRLFISSSGPLSFAFSFEKPILLSDNLKPYFQSQDMKQALKKAGLNIKDFTFNSSNFSKKISQFENVELRNKLVKLSKLMRKKRSWDQVGKKYLQVLYEQN
jgi:glycosyltransferase involved in cell wall biosynthesis